MMNRILKHFLPAFFLLITFISCAQKPEGYTNIDSDSMEKMMKDVHVVILDVRTPEEYNEGHVPGAINIDYLSDGFEKGIDTLNKELVYEVYCRSGGRSSQSAEIMAKKGFKNIYHLENGFMEWSKKGKPVVK